VKWFKHISDSLDDPFIFDLVDRFGGDGYMVFFGTLEIMSREFDIKNPGVCTIPQRFLIKKLQLSRQKTVKILKFCDENKRILFGENGRNFTLNCPKLKEICDDWTKRLLRSSSEVTTKKHRTEEDVRSKNENKNDKEIYIYSIKPKKYLSGIKLELFNKFWNVWDDKRGKPKAAKSWDEILKFSPELAYEIIEGAKKYNIERKRILARNGTPKMAQGWLTDRRWEDEINITENGGQKDERWENIARKIQNGDL